MPKVHLKIHLGGSPLRNAWVYVKNGTQLETLRTGQTGKVLRSSGGSSDAASPQEPAKRIASYARPYVTEAPSTIKIFYSREALALPLTLLDACDFAFWEREIAVDDLQTQSAAVASNNINTLVLFPVAIVDVPEIVIGIESPRQLELWPLRLQLPGTEYETAGLSQGLDIWDKKVVQGGPPPAAPKEATPQPVPLVVTLRAESSIKGGELRVFGATGNAMKMREGNRGTPVVEKLSVVSSDDGRLFVRFIPDDCAKAFGLIHLIITGTKRGEIVDRVCQLAGLQLGLTDDFSAGLAGTEGGRPSSQSDEKVVVDFLASPGFADDPSEDIEEIDRQKKSAIKNLGLSARARRMVVYWIKASRKRPQPGGGDLLTPEMPLWMAELQLLGVTEATLLELLTLRSWFLPESEAALKIETAFNLDIAWETPDRDHSRANPYKRQRSTFVGIQTADGFKPDGTIRLGIALDEAGKAPDDDAAGEAGPEATSSSVILTASPPRVPVPFPVTTRRRPRVRLYEKIQRPWGWSKGAPVVDALIIEHQPLVFVTEEGDARTGRQRGEVMRGGDGVLSVAAVLIDGRAVESEQTDEGPMPVLRLPTFRVMGGNPTALSDVLPIMEAAVDRTIADNVNNDCVKMLSAGCWKETIKKIAQHESRSAQFEERPSGRWPFVQKGKKKITVKNADGKSSTKKVPYVKEVYCSGWENGMPKFGAPAGYGIGQHDPPRSIDDVWNFAVNCALSVRILMMDKAQSAWSHLNGSGHTLDRTKHRDRAVFQRELVRRYNGGKEFAWDKNARTWNIKLATSPDREGYANIVAARSGSAPVAYSRDGTAAFLEANYGDRTDEMP